jgi:hypothetical protein
VSCADLRAAGDGGRVPGRAWAAVLLKIYAGCIDGDAELVNWKIDKALTASRARGLYRADIRS